MSCEPMPMSVIWSATSTSNQKPALKPGLKNLWPGIRNIINFLAYQQAEYVIIATPHETTKIMAAWASVPAQLAKENHKFQYKVIKSGARAYDYEIPLDWLKAAGIINKCVRIHEGKMPLSAYADNTSFKLYMADTGLLCSKFDIQANIS